MQFIDIHTNVILLIASKTYSGHNKVIVYYTALIFIFEFFRQISHYFLESRINKLLFVIATLISLFFSFQNGKTEYNYVNVLPNIFMPLSLIAKSNLTYDFFF